jgi:ABC-type transport system involved in cytochrome bd biosynthesis fused ATPase/permease subunit
MLRSGVPFWWALLSSCVLTFLLYLGTVIVAARFGVRL